MSNKTFWAMKRREQARRAEQSQPVRRGRRTAARRARPEDRAAVPYRELQAAAKDAGIPANQSREELESALGQSAETTTAADVAQDALSSDAQTGEGAQE